MIRELQVKNFLSLRDVDLQLGPINLLVGPNMAGKSNVIDVFRFLSQTTQAAAGAYGLPNAILALGGMSELVWKGSNSNLISVRVRGDWPSTAQEAQATQWDYGLSVVGDPWGFTRVQEESLAIRTGGQSHDLVKTADGRRHLVRASGQAVTQVGDMSRSVLEFEVPDWEGNRVRKLFGSFQFHRVFPPAMKEPNQMQGQRFLQETDPNLSSWLMTLQTSHPGAFARIEAVMKDAFPGLQGLFTVPTQQATVLVSSKERFLHRPVPVHRMSDGELSFLAFLSLTFSPPELMASLCCIEEPEAHLHPRLLQILVEILRQEHESRPPHERGQVLLTTHSPYLVDQFKLEELVVLEKREGATVCTRPSERAEVRELLERKELGLGDLVYSGALSGGR